MQQIPLSGIKKIEEIAGKSKEHVSLAQGSIKVGGIPEEIKAYVQEMLKTDKTDYYESCWGLRILREKLATVLSKQYKTSFVVNQILPTHGCIGALSLLYLTLLDPGDEVLLPEPCYSAYTILAQASRVNVKHVSCKKKIIDDDGWGKDTGWELDVEAIKKATTSKTKIILFSNPVNPLGMVISSEKITELISWCEENKIYLVIDEAYREYVFDGNFVSGLEFVNKSEWVVSANTFSKNMAMSGWRIGYVVGSLKLIKALAGMQDALLNCINNVGQYAAIYALDHPELTQKFYEKIKRNRDLAIELLQPLVDRNIISYTKPDGGFYIFFKTHKDDALDVAMNLLSYAKVGLIPGNSFGPTGKPYLRLCYARETDVLEQGISRLVDYLL